MQQYKLQCVDITSSHSGTLPLWFLLTIKVILSTSNNIEILYHFLQFFLFMESCMKFLYLKSKHYRWVSSASISFLFLFSQENLFVDLSLSGPCHGTVLLNTYYLVQTFDVPFDFLNVMPKFNTWSLVVARIHIVIIC